MNRRIRPLASLLVLALALVGLAACGSKKSESNSGTGQACATNPAASATSDPTQLLRDTFATKHNYSCGVLNFSLNANVSGSSQVQGPISLTLTGPFQSGGQGNVPKFDLEAAFSGAGRNIKAGVISTGDAAFVKLNDQAYSVPQQYFDRFKQGYVQAQQRNANQPNPLQAMGIHPEAWVTSPQLVGEEDVGGTTTQHVSGQVNVSALIDDINTILGKAGSMGLPNTGSLPRSITPEQKAKIEQALKNVTIDVWTGKQDHALRKLQLKLNASQGSQTVGLDLSIGIDHLNEGQNVSAPENPKPFTELQGALGGLLGTGGSSSSGGSSAPSGSASPQKLQQYQQCIQQAGTDQAKQQQCTSILTG